jgi:multimeric flavodoxin WrbA
MISPRNLARYFGFTKDEVSQLASKHAMDFDELTKWYDGYQIGAETSMFNPNSVMQAVISQWCESYWGKTGTYDTVASYISMNFEGLKDDIIAMLAGASCKVNTTRFQNDMSIIDSKDDVLTVLIHLGYLSYDRVKQECKIPNKEVANEISNAVEDNKWNNVINSLKASRQLLKATLNGDEEAVVHGIELAHDENTSILSYNNENSLSCVISLAYYYAQNDYIIHRELPSGKGFADLVFIPRKNVNTPALLVELKCDKDVNAAISQIKQKNYPSKLADYMGNILLVGINYDRRTKKHTCRIEKA